MTMASSTALLAAQAAVLVNCKVSYAESSSVLVFFNSPTSSGRKRALFADYWHEVGLKHSVETQQKHRIKLCCDFQGTRSDGWVHFPAADGEFAQHEHCVITDHVDQIAAVSGQSGANAPIESLKAFISGKPRQRVRAYNTKPIRYRLGTYSATIFRPGFASLCVSGRSCSETRPEENAK